MERAADLVPEGRGSRNYCFTLNNPDGLLDFSLSEKVTFAVYQLEIGEEGTPHFQGYLELDSQVRITTMLGWDTFPAQGGNLSLRFASRKGSQAQAIRYCIKPDPWKGASIPDATRVEGPWWYGEPKTQGQRADLLEIQRAIRGGATLKRIADDDFPNFCKFPKAISDYIRMSTPFREHLTQFIIIIGPSGVGKSRLARSMAPDAYWKPPGRWWNDYAHDCVIWDEFTGGSYPFRELLRILDSAPLALETKGSSVQFFASLVIFTSNLHPRDWYNEENIHVPWDESPLRRRLEEFGEIIDLTPPAPIPNLCPHCQVGLCAFHHP